MKTVWLLDVDGVVNASRAGWSAPPRTATAYGNGVGYRLRWEPKLLDRATALHRSGRVEVQWATTWCDHVPELRRVFGVDFPAAFGARPSNLSWGEMKLFAALDVLRAGYRLVWTDDQEVPGALAVSTEIVRAERDGRALLIAPKPSRGLRPEDVDAIEAYAAQEESLPKA